ncbi:ATP-dependent (S)-NAD(P)H-hydrate dehydratase [Talaromyces atroroseus]|uniref:ATP-dependent (S)-NAD(P)H-hydrate dehydratase n=1 Tax=Talaromyces atroroseus TaxID=1441469 RepID=A0A225AP82_TALAT|nr:ATP-dependent (S)-NAD(P)H-hydrate dehydratase [Talaromyces atroroseus]OKL56776.1 ATP-dependent (S)-NAD(P)H-hydrate dehydratase [Talaromyces atroroseus]
MEHEPMKPVHITTPSSTLLARVKTMVPPMLEKFHKGQLGRVAVIGGSADYTGAPYFSAMASARLGCDMVIKAYSPNLMVHPILPSSASVSDPDSNKDPSSLASPILDMLPRLHVLVIGPGLGRDGVTQKVVVEVMREARNRSVPFILDADGLMLVTEKPELVKGYKECILTPNVVEFGRLAKALGVKVQRDEKEEGNEEKQLSGASEACEKLSQALGGVTIIQKGPKDIISNGVTSIISDIQGGLKRSGGQGDTLTGSLGTLLAWRAAYHDGLWDTGEKAVPSSKSDAQTKDEVQSELENKDQKMSSTTTLLLTAYAGSAITRDCSRRAFESKGRSMQASDLTDEVHEAFLGLIGEPEQSKL